MSSTSGAIFTGSSSYAKDFQNVVARAVSIASLPLQQMTAEQTTLSKQSGEMAAVDQKVASVHSALTDIGKALNSSFDTKVSNPDVLSATVGAGAGEGTYSILVSEAGAFSTMMTRTWAAAEESAHTYELWIGAAKYDVQPADNSAASVAAAINSSYGDKARATVVNVGPASAPDYRISIQTVKLTEDLVDLRDGGSLQEQQTAGKAAQYEVNSSGITVSSDTRTVTIADGVTINLIAKNATAATVTVTRSVSALADALRRFASAYNSAVDELDKHRGASNGSLQGDPTVARVSAALAGMVTYASGDGLTGLKDLGVDLGSDGKLTFNSFDLTTKSIQNAASVASFLGSSASGGFLMAADQAMKELEDPTTGLIKTAEAELKAQTARLENTISEKQAQVDALERQLSSRMAAADAMISAMEQQYGYVYNMFSAMRTASEQYK